MRAGILLRRRVCRVQVEGTRGAAVAAEYCMKFFQCSAKEGTNVQEAFQTIARDVLAVQAAAEGGAAAAAAASAVDAAAAEGVAVGSPAGGKEGGKDGKQCVVQ